MKLTTIAETMKKSRKITQINPEKLHSDFFALTTINFPLLCNKYSPGEFPFGLNSSFKPNLNGIFTTGLALCKKCQLIPRQFGFVCYHLAPLLKWRRLTLWLPLLSNRFFFSLLDISFWYRNDHSLLGS